MDFAKITLGLKKDIWFFFFFHLDLEPLKKLIWLIYHIPAFKIPWEKAREFVINVIDVNNTLLRRFLSINATCKPTYFIHTKKHFSIICFENKCFAMFSSFPSWISNALLYQELFLLRYKNLQTLLLTFLEFKK